MKVTIINPKCRLIAMLITLVGIILCSNLLVMSGFVICCILFVVLFKLYKQAISFLTYIVLPTSVGLILTWAVILAKSPEQDGFYFGLCFALLITFRLISIGLIFQITFLTIPDNQRIQTFYGFGLRGHSLLVFISTLTLWPEFKRRTQQIYEARLARGMMPTRSILYRIIQMPAILKSLFTYSLISASDRINLWSERNTLENFHNSDYFLYPKVFTFKSVFIVLICLLWLTIVILIKNIY
jgi:energy-coupling factor transport system permease protein